jgi:hypothetical protein
MIYYFTAGKQLGGKQATADMAEPLKLAIYLSKC